MRDVDALLRWLADNGAYVSDKLQVKNDDETGIGVWAKHGIQDEEILFRISKSLLLSKRTSKIADNPEWQQECERLTKFPDFAGHNLDTLILTAVVTYELSLGKASRWSVFLESCPTWQEISLPSFWSDETAKDWLQGTDVEGLLQSQGCDEASLRRFFVTSVLQFLPVNTADNAPTNFEIFKQAYSLVSSRSFQVDNYHGHCMVPYADLFNHHYNPHVTLQSDDIVCPSCGSFEECQHDTEDAASRNSPTSFRAKFTQKMTTDDNTVEIIATDHVSGDTGEVFNTYGARLSNAQLLVNYGFSIDSNEDDRVSWFSVASVLKNIGLDLSSFDSAAIQASWTALLPELVSIRPGLGDPLNRISQDYFEASALYPSLSAHSSHKPAHELLYIDADAAVSPPLWTLLAVAHAHKQGRSGLSLAVLAESPVESVTELVQALCTHRLKSLKGASLSTDEMWQMHAKAQGRSVGQAMLRNIEERTLLTACWHAWQA